MEKRKTNFAKILHVKLSTMQTYFRWPNICFLLLLLGLCVNACKKNNSTIVQNGPYKIIHKGGQYVGETVYFSTAAPGNGRFLWDFGDGITSSSSAPSHIYRSDGAFHVVLVYNDTDTMGTVVNIGGDSLVMAKIPGMKFWHHSYLFSNVGVSDTIHIYTDTTFFVELIDPRTVRVGSDTLICSSTTNAYPAGALYTFVNTFYFYNANPSTSHNTLYFFSGTDSMGYRVYNQISNTSHSVDDYYTN